jgi:hypothetical protein
MWTYTNDYCEILGHNRREGREWEYVAVTHGLKQHMRGHEDVKAIFGSFHVVGRKVEYRCYVGTDRDIRKWKIFQPSCDGEMLDDIRWLIDGKATPIV